MRAKVQLATMRPCGASESASFPVARPKVRRPEAGNPDPAVCAKISGSRLTTAGEA
jgi:hypothetical protein